MCKVIEKLRGAKSWKGTTERRVSFIYWYWKSVTKESDIRATEWFVSVTRNNRKKPSLLHLTEFLCFFFLWLIILFKKLIKIVVNFPNRNWYWKSVPKESDIRATDWFVSVRRNNRKKPTLLHLTEFFMFFFSLAENFVQEVVQNYCKPSKWKWLEWENGIFYWV